MDCGRSFLCSFSSVPGWCDSLQVTRSLGWKIILTCAATYCLLYVYERVTWTAKAKHDSFDRQYISYAASQLAMVAGIVTEHCSSQVERY